MQTHLLLDSSLLIASTFYRIVNEKETGQAIWMQKIYGLCSKIWS